MASYRTNQQKAPLKTPPAGFVRRFNLLKSSDQAICDKPLVKLLRAASRVPLRRGVLVLLAAAGVAACVGAGQQAVFRCDAGVEVVITYPDDPQGAVQFTSGEHQRTLPRARAASGVRYADDDLVWWEKGASGFATLQGASIARGCERQA